jgi:hypothetical protein
MIMVSKPQELSAPGFHGDMLTFCFLFVRYDLMPTNCCQCFSEVNMISIKAKIAYSMLLPFLNLNSSETKILFNSKCWFNLLNLNVSRTFDNESNGDTGLQLEILLLSLFLWIGHTNAY